MQMRPSRCSSDVTVAIQVVDGDGGECQQEAVRTTTHAVLVATSLAARSTTSSVSLADDSIYVIISEVRQLVADIISKAIERRLPAGIFAQHRSCSAGGHSREALIGGWAWRECVLAVTVHLASKNWSIILGYRVCKTKFKGVLKVEDYYLYF